MSRCKAWKTWCAALGGAVVETATRSRGWTCLCVHQGGCLTRESHAPLLRVAVSRMLLLVSSTCRVSLCFDCFVTDRFWACTAPIHAVLVGVALIGWSDLPVCVRHAYVVLATRIRPLILLSAALLCATQQHCVGCCAGSLVACVQDRGRFRARALLAARQAVLASRSTPPSV